MRLEAYDRGGFHDEMFDDAGSVRPEARMLLETIESTKANSCAANGLPSAPSCWIERGLKQRIHALNAFIDDIYHDQ